MSQRQNCLSGVVFILMLARPVLFSKFYSQVLGYLFFGRPVSFFEKNQRLHKVNDGHFEADSYEKAGFSLIGHISRRSLEVPNGM